MAPGEVEEAFSSQEETQVATKLISWFLQSHINLLKITPSMRKHVNNFMVSNPCLHTKSMNIQFNLLIVAVFRRLELGYCTRRPSLLMRWTSVRSQTQKKYPCAYLGRHYRQKNYHCVS